MFFNRKKRCKFCAGELVNDKCKNEKCIKYKPDETVKQTKKSK